MTNHKRGFTLVELSIVLVIISLMVGGIIGGKSLIKSSELQALIKDTKNIETSYNTFILQYDALPGDMTDASAYWSDCAVSNCNGDGDGAIRDNYNPPAGTIYNENHRAVGHMELAGFRLKQNISALGLSGQEMYTNDLKITPSFKNSMIQIFNESIYPNNGTGFSGNAQLLAHIDSNRDPIILAQDAYIIDKKLDDGNASEGKVMTLRAFGGSGCVSGNVWNTSVTYNKDDTTNLCRMLFYLDSN